ncbi:hypothetical protein [Legionella sp. km772]|uniref:hypothetical protein n=1 Tax=Legionella sp. km772 TaxID=2498111 RepID=UPI000F8D4218|nr:hypothetical protein [Legionella sp. km772]RUR12550.1 hypothetical protein ELY15_04860 [Legionella sp. km772]
MSSTKLDPIATSITIAVFLAIALFVLVIVANIFLEGIPVTLTVGSLQIIYNASILNTVVFSLTAFISGLIGGFFGGYIFSRLYNYLTDLIHSE